MCHVRQRVAASVSPAGGRNITTTTTTTTRTATVIVVTIAWGGRRRDTGSLVWSNAARASHSCLRNVVSVFHVLEEELQFRRARGLPPGFEGLRSRKTVVAVGPEHALEDEFLMEDGFHGSDGLHGVHEAVGTHTERPLATR